MPYLIIKDQNPIHPLITSTKPTSPCLKLNHPAERKVSTSLITLEQNARKKNSNQPLSPLLVKHTMTTILTPNLVSPLQRHLRRAFTAEIRGNGALSCSSGNPIRAEGVLRAQGGNLVGFTRHVGVFLCE